MSLERYYFYLVEQMNDFIFIFTHHWMIDKLDLIINIISYFVYYQHVKFNALDSLIVFNLHIVLQYILWFFHCRGFKLFGKHFWLYIREFDAELT